MPRTAQFLIAADCFEDATAYQYNATAQDRGVNDSGGQGRPQRHVNLENWCGRPTCALIIRELVAREVQNARRQTIVARMQRRLKETFDCIGGKYIVSVDEQQILGVGSFRRAVARRIDGLVALTEEDPSPVTVFLRHVVE